MTTYSDINPRKRSVSEEPADDPVQVVERPGSYQQLLTDTDFAEDSWNSSFGSDEFFYLAGVNDAMRLLQEQSATFLKLRGHLDDISHIQELARWSNQCGIPLDIKVKRESAGRIAEPIPTRFAKCVVCLLAFERAIDTDDRLKGKVSGLWVYDYMRIVPAVYNLQGFNTDRLVFLRERIPSFDRDALEAIHQDNEELLDDLAGGYTVTRKTAHLLKGYIDRELGDEAGIGRVRVRPGTRGLGKGPASPHEVIDRPIPPSSSPESDADV